MFLYIDSILVMLLTRTGLLKYHINSHSIILSGILTAWWYILCFYSSMHKTFLLEINIIKRSSVLYNSIPGVIMHYNAIHCIHEI